MGYYGILWYFQPLFKKKNTRWHISRILFLYFKVVTINLEQLLPVISSIPPSYTQSNACHKKWLGLLGLAPKGVYKTFLVTKEVVSSYLTISPLPQMWRYIFCCTFPRVAPAGRYPALVLWWVRTFLLKKAVTQPSSIVNKSNLNSFSQHFFIFN